MLMRPQELVFREFRKLKIVESILRQKKEILGFDFLNYILRHILAQEAGEGIKLITKNQYPIKELVKNFERIGFKITPFIYEPSQISVRGDIIEFWDEISLYPVRLEFFDREIETIYFYDLRTKKRIESIKQLFVYPVKFLQSETLKGRFDGVNPIKFKEYQNKKILDLPIKNHFKTNFLDVVKLAKKKNQIIFIFSRFESAFRELTQNHKSKIYFLPPVDFNGFSLENIHLFTDADFERKIKRRRFAKIVEFGVGDFVVHIDHGICKLEGIGPKALPMSFDEQIIGAKERKDFYYHLRFRHNAFLYAHLSEKNRITKYIGSNPRLSALGGREWQEAKVLATLEAKHLAQKLAKMFTAIKQQKIELALSKIEIALKKMAISFDFNLTPSQAKVILEIKSLIKKNKPFDHLVAGEASSGKTEVSLRVASMFLINGKQVLFLAPTTFLAYQNFLVAKSRLANIGIQVGILSRFNSDDENKKTINAYNEGRIKFLVGTHKILFSNLKLKKTGLLMIDEEQRFGVEQKEKIRIKKPNISILSLSATPIPRTLNLALTGVKTMSLLSDMPFERGNVENAILSQDDFKNIKKFIKLELKQNGQVYFVSPLIKDLHEIEAQLNKIGIKKVVLAHGRMNEKKLAAVFSDFALGKIKVLLSTAIVEHGLDFPRANTMILWFGERLGMADLYQLRGRIGRSNKDSHFVLAVPKNISDSSYGRLIDFLALIKEPNAFYQLSLKDLETRGEGEIFGKRQHGVINRVGLYLFSDLVQKELKT